MNYKPDHRLEQFWNSLGAGALMAQATPRLKYLINTTSLKSENIGRGIVDKFLWGFINLTEHQPDENRTYHFVGDIEFKYLGKSLSEKLRKDFLEGNDEFMSVEPDIVVPQKVIMPYDQKSLDDVASNIADHYQGSVFLDQKSLAKNYSEALGFILPIYIARAMNKGYISGIQGVMSALDLSKGFNPGKSPDAGNPSNANNN